MILHKKLYHKYFLPESIVKKIGYTYKSLYSIFRKRLYLQENHFNVPMLNAKNGLIACNACNLCAKVCPSSCIEVEQKDDSRKAGSVKAFNIQFNSCIQCYKCEEVCPENAIELRFEEVDVYKNKGTLTIDDLIFDPFKKDESEASSKND